MVNRTATYFAFDGLGESDPSKSDFKYYATIQGWDASNSIEFKFVNSHDKAAPVRDTSKEETIKASIRERLMASKNMVVILSDKTRDSGSLLSYEIEKAVDHYQIPLIISYTGFSSMMNPRDHSRMWPNSLRDRLNNGTANAIHIPFKKDALLVAINQFTVNSGSLNCPWHFYSAEAHRNWGYIT